MNFELFSLRKFKINHTYTWHHSNLFKGFFNKHCWNWQLLRLDDHYLNMSVYLFCKALAYKYRSLRKSNVSESCCQAPCDLSHPPPSYDPSPSVGARNQRSPFWFGCEEMPYCSWQINNLSPLYLAPKNKGFNTFNCLIEGTISAWPFGPGYPVHSSLQGHVSWWVGYRDKMDAVADI